VGSSGRASIAQGCTLGWGMFGPRGADASGYALGGFDIARSVAVELLRASCAQPSGFARLSAIPGSEFWAVGLCFGSAFDAGLPRVVARILRATLRVCTTLRHPWLRVVEVNSTIAPSRWASALKGPLKNSPTLGDSRATARSNAMFTPRR